MREDLKDLYSGIKRKGEQMMNDPIVEEIRRYRKEHAEQFGNNLSQIVAALRQKERESKHVLLNPGPKLLLRTGA